MKKTFILIKASIFLYACSPSPADISNHATSPPSKDTTTYQQPVDTTKLSTKQLLPSSNSKPLLIASGTEPGWLLNIYTDKFVFIAHYGQDTLQEPFSVNIQHFPIRYKSQTLSFLLEKKNCIAISGETMPVTATIEYKGNKWIGCGKLLP